MSEKPRKSIFAQRMSKGRERNNQSKPPDQSERRENPPASDFGGQSYISFGPDADSIHAENVEKLSSMSRSELIAEQQKLVSSLDPGLVDFIKSRRANLSKDVPQKQIQEEKSENLKPVVEEEDVKQLLNKYPHMDVVEDEKLQWIGELPKEAVPPNEPYSARFNFEGSLCHHPRRGARELLPYIDKGEGVLLGLHNHGEEQERPGYTLQELIQLSRSSVLQQRVIALNCLAKIMANASKYDECFNEPILPALLDADMYLLLRFSLDDPALPIVMASSTAICNLIVNHTDELCLDVLMGSPLGIQQPSFGVAIEMKPDEISELKDQELLKLDIIKGMFRTNILERSVYVINHLPSEPIEIKSILKMFIRISRHSYESAEAVFSCQRLLSTVNDLLLSFKKGSYYPEALKLFRILAARSVTLANKIIEKYSILDTICQFIAGERAQGHPEEMQLALESFYTWQTFMNYNLANSVLNNLFPVLMKLLEAHVGLTSLASTKSDLEHGTALISTLSSAAKNGCEIVFKAYPLLLQGASKWISQISPSENLSFSASKLIGSSLQFLTNCLEFAPEQSINPYIFKLFQKNIFSKIASKLRNCSWLIDGKTVSCPENLPCLGSLPPTVHKGSVLPFMIQLGTYILAQKNLQLNDLFINDPEVLLYINRVSHCENLQTMSGHWYARQEIHFLTLLVHIYSRTESNTNASLIHNLACDLVISVQRGDKHLLPEIISKTIFNKRYFGLDMKNISEKLQSLEIENSTVENSKKRVYFEMALNNVENIEKCYIQELGLGNMYKPPITSSLTGIVNGTESALPSDWVFLPILRVYENEGRIPNSDKILRCCLDWIIIIEELFPKLASSFSFSAKYCRLCCVYLASSDLFREVTDQLEICLSYVTNNYKYLNFESEIPGLKSFYDFYRQVLDQYCAVSYCDLVFGQYVLVPLAQKHSIRYKKLIWSELAAAIRILRTPLIQVDFNHYSEPIETDFNLLMIYLQSLATGRVLELWCPVLYKVAVHHVSNYVAKYDDKFSKILLDRINKLGNKTLRDVLLKPSTV